MPSVGKGLQDSRVATCVPSYPSEPEKGPKDLGKSPALRGLTLATLPHLSGRLSSDFWQGYWGHSSCLLQPLRITMKTEMKWN